MFYSDISINCPIKFKNAIKEPRQPFPNGEFYDFEGDRYCLHCYQVLYAPECQKCGEFVNGEVVKVISFLTKQLLIEDTLICPQNPIDSHFFWLYFTPDPV